MRIQTQLLFWLGGLALLVAAFYVFSSVMLPFTAGITIAYLLDPVATRLQKRGVNRLGATIVILSVFLIAIAMVFIVIVPILSHQLAGFIESLPANMGRLQTLAVEQGTSLSGRYGAALEKLGLSNGLGPADIQKTIGEVGGQATQWAGAFLKGVWSSGAALVGVFSLLIVTPVVAFYMLLDWDKMIAALDSWAPVRHRGDVREIAREIDAALAGFFRGQSLVCLFLGLWYGIGLSLVGLNFGLLIGISAGLLSFIPYVGSLLALVISVAVAIVQGWPDYTLLLAALGVVLTGQFLEGNILSPKLVGDSVGLHPVWLMFALFAFGAVFGFSGLIIAVPVSAAVGVILRFALRQYLASPLYTGEEPPPEEPVLVTTRPELARIEPAASKERMRVE